MVFCDRLRIEHWKTTSYSKHKLFEHAEKEMRELLDTFVETAIGHCDHEMEHCVHEYLDHPYPVDTRVSIDILVREYIIKVQNFQIQNSALASIRDDILVLLYEFRYLYRLQ